MTCLFFRERYVWFGVLHFLCVAVTVLHPVAYAQPPWEMLLAAAGAVMAAAVEVDPLCEAAHVHLAHLALQQNDLKGAVQSYDKAISLLRMHQELSDAYSMREVTH